MYVSELVSSCKPGIFALLNKWKGEAEAKGIKVINLGIGSPDKAPADFILKKLVEECKKKDNYSYPFILQDLKEAIAYWYKERFSVELDPVEEVEVVWGTQEGIAHLPLAVMNYSDRCFVTNPAYPIYLFAPKLVNAKIKYLPLLEENNFLPVLEDIDPDVAKEAKMMIINYPNNPLAAVADISFFRKVIDFAKEYGILVVHDAAYTELSFDGYKSPSILSVPGAKEIAVEFNSFSKTFNMAGMRIGFLVGNKKAVGALSALKSNIDYGIFKPIQLAAIEALRHPKRDEFISEVSKRYQSRRDILVETLNKYGWNVKKPKATMFVWAKVPEGFTSMSFVEFCLKEAGVVFTPGEAFGSLGEGYVRIALVQDEDILEEAAYRVGKALEKR